MAYDAKSGTTLLFGGYSGGGKVLGDTWQWDGKDWKQFKPTVSPSARVGSAMAYDSARGKIVLFGGRGKTGLLQDTWEWDGKAWTQRHPKLSPSKTSAHAMTYDPLRKKMFLLDAQSRGTWAWDGTNWKQLKSIAPPPQIIGSLVFDATRNTILFFPFFGAASPQIWEWDGKTWKQLKTLTSPTRMDWFRVVYNDHRKRTHLWGRVSRSTRFESWEWDGQDWTLTKPQYVPTSRWGTFQDYGAMVFDLQRARIVLFGGRVFRQQVYTTYLHDTRELHAPAQSIKTIGSGCQGSNLLTPTLIGKGDPRPGGVVYFQTEKCLLLTPLALFFGFAKVRFDLKPLGAPGCIVQANPSVVILGQTGLLGAWRTPGMSLPMIPEIVGGKYWTQAVAYDPKANRLQLTVTNALETTVGY